MTGIQNSAGMGSGKSSRPDEMMGEARNKHLHTGTPMRNSVLKGGGFDSYTSPQKKVMKKMSAKKRRQRDNNQEV
jgi:hypothetical protein